MHYTTDSGDFSQARRQPKPCSSARTQVLWAGTPFIVLYF